jgi:large subunit ribosomal protein L34e
MHRSSSFKKANRVTSTGRNVIHYKRARPSQPHCAICRAELNGIGTKGGKSRRTNSRIFGGVLCPGCTSDVVKLGSRVEHGEMKLDDIGVRQKSYVLQLLAH